MDNQKFQNLLQDEKFIEVVGGEDTVAGIEEKLNKEGLAVTKTDVETLIDKGIKSVNDGTLEAISGGNRMWEGFKAGFTLRRETEWREKEKKEADEFIEKNSDDPETKRHAIEKAKDVYDEITGETLGTYALLGGVATIGAAAGVFIPKLIKKLKK